MDFAVFQYDPQGEDVLERLEKIPVYGSNRLEPGSLMDKAFRAQNVSE